MDMFLGMRPEMRELLDRARAMIRDEVTPLEEETGREVAIGGRWQFTERAAAWISQIKVVAPRMTLKAIDDAVRMHGRQEVSQDTLPARAWNHVRTLRLADGPDVVHRRQIAPAELKKQTQEKV